MHSVPSQNSPVHGARSLLTTVPRIAAFLAVVLSLHAAAHADQGGFVMARDCTVAGGVSITSGSSVPAGGAHVAFWHAWMWDWPWSTVSSNGVQGHACSTASGQGYSFVPYIESSSPGTSPSVCNAQAFLRMLDDPQVSVMVLMGHGNTGILSIMTFDHSTAGRAAAEAEALILQNRGLTVSVGEHTPTIGNDCWVVDLIVSGVSGPGGGLGGGNTLASSRLVVLGACASSPETSDGFVTSGAAACVGYAISPAIKTVDQDVYNLFSRMNGLDPSSIPGGACPYGPTSQAPICVRNLTTAVAMSNDMQISGNGDMVLNPSVVEVTHSDGNVPLYIGETIHFRFDAACDTSVPPEARVRFGGSLCGTPQSWGELEITTVGVWANATEARFEVTAPILCGGTMAIEEYVIELMHESIVGQNNATTKLDGNKLPRTTQFLPGTGSNPCDCNAITLNEHALNARDPNRDNYIYDPYCLWDFWTDW